jgi:hypothetical protein
MSRVFKGLRALRAPGVAIAGNASMRGVGTKMGTVSGNMAAGRKEHRAPIRCHALESQPWFENSRGWHPH